MRVVIVGATGYVGMTLMRILASHPEVDSIVPVSRSSAGKAVREVDPGMGVAVDGRLRATAGRYTAIEDAKPDEADVIFSALPHGAAAGLVGGFVGSMPVIDLSADFRITDADLYESTYGTTHPYPKLLDHAVYGLTEWHREEIATAALVACPGCYPTATLLPLLPFVDIVKPPAIVNAISGISGAGRKEKTDLLYNERSENLNAYNPGRVHRHVPEIEQELARAATARAKILFTPHLAPVKQGMFVSIVAELREPFSRDGALSQGEAEMRITDAYGGSPFVGLSPRGIPQTRDVRGTNRCDLGVVVHGERVQLFAAIDNLVKGASGQAVQNMNVRFGLDETAGLRVHGEF
jgi:N-acetyl-gamma-glutamyl-phosphate reductase